MENLRVKGFRSINDSGIINIKPITAFLGKNSCGKSTFIKRRDLCRISSFLFILYSVFSVYSSTFA